MIQKKIDLRGLDRKDKETILLATLSSIITTEKTEDLDKLLSEFYRYACTDDFMVGKDAQELIGKIILLGQGKIIRLLINLDIIDISEVVNNLLKEGGDE